ncbi:Potassium channel SKOR [Glycine soja]
MNTTRRREIRKEDDDAEENTITLHTYSSFGQVSFFCNMPQTSTVDLMNFARWSYIVMKNLLEVKDLSLQRKLLVSEFNLTIGNMETELATRMNCAAHDGHLDLVKRLIGFGADPNKTDYDGRTPLHISSIKSASEGLFTRAELLLEAGASVLSKDRWGNTSLHEAHTGGDRNMIKMLEVAKASQLPELSDNIHETQVFRFHPWDQKADRKEGVVLRVPQSIQELIKEASKHLEIPNGSCILSEQSGKIVYVETINNDEKLFLVSEEHNE